jgi:hypothetical protein
MFNTTNATFVLQVFSNRKLNPPLASKPNVHRYHIDNSSGTPRDWMTPGPMLLLVAYDPKFSLLDAFTNGPASITHIPMLVSTNTVVSLVYRIG